MRGKQKRPETGSREGIQTPNRGRGGCRGGRHRGEYSQGEKGEVTVDPHPGVEEPLCVSRPRVSCVHLDRNGTLSVFHMKKKEERRKGREEEEEEEEERERENEKRKETRGEESWSQAKESSRLSSGRLTWIHYGGQ